MIRIVLALIGVAFCILSSLTAPAHAAAVSATYNYTPLGSLSEGVVHDQFNNTMTITMFQQNLKPTLSPDPCSSGNDSSHLP
jgi:hypothetical protein